MDIAVKKSQRSLASRGILELIDSAMKLLTNYGAPILDLVIRFWVGKVFFMSGLVKIQSWSTTLALFESEYQVPVLPPQLAAYLGTGAELILPVFIVLGLGGRIAAAALFVFNIIAVMSYPDLSEVGLKDHQYWGLMMLVTLFHGPGKLSIDHFLRRKLLG